MSGYFQAVRPLHINGKAVSAGEVVEIDDTAEVKALLNLKAIIEAEPSDATREALETGDGQADDEIQNEDILTKIVAVISQLDSEKDFTQGGTPKVKAVETALGEDVTGEQVADAFKIYEGMEPVDNPDNADAGGKG